MLKGNNKGYTLLEILAAAAILVLILTIAIKTYNSISKKSKEKYYIKQEELITQAGKDYFNDNRNLLPQASGESVCVTLKTLIENKYIEKIESYNKKECSKVDSNICVVKLSNNKYIYYPELSCFIEYKSASYKSPIVTIIPEKSDNIMMDENAEKEIIINYYYDKDKDEKEESFLASYRYVIYKKIGDNYTLYYDSKWKNIDGKVSEKELKVKLNKTGTYYVETWVYNEKGKMGSNSSGEVTLSFTNEN